MITIYGINNCDTVKRARKALEREAIPYQFHDLRQNPLDPSRLQDWLNQLPRDTLINRRGTTFRQLPESDRQLDSDAAAMQLMLRYPTLIKRPVIEHAGTVRVGFAKADEAEILAWLRNH